HNNYTRYTHPLYNYTPSDILNSTTTDALLAIVNEIKDSELQATLADNLWIMKKATIDIAKLAINSYINSAKYLFGEDNTREALTRVERAFTLSKNINKGKPDLSIINYIEDLTNKIDKEDRWILLRLISMLA